jgi:lipid-A-disaccharide synthase
MAANQKWHASIISQNVKEKSIVKPKTFMLIAGEASGDLLAAELVAALRSQLPDAKFFGAGGARMAAAGVELAFDLTQHSVIGITDVLKNILKFRRLFNRLLALAIERQPDVVIGVDYGGFNLRFGQAVKKNVRDNPFSQWDPKIVQFVSPQVWASRPGRADKLARDYDLLLSIFPFEKDWYAQRAPKLRVEFVGHPMVERMQESKVRSQKSDSTPIVLLLPGSRVSELQRHLPILSEAARLIRAKQDVHFRMVLPDENLIELAERIWEPQWIGSKLADGDNIPIPFKVLHCQIGNLPDALAAADVAIASTGTVTMECAFFRVPTVTLYKTSWLTYQIAKRIITVKSLTMPNLLAGETVYPEFVQNDATPENLSRAALELLQDQAHRTKIKSQITKIISSLGEPGAAKRAANAVLNLLP